MIKVCVYVDYVNDDITLTAVQLADWLVRLGVNVTLLSRSRIKKGIHPYWDNKALVLSKSGTSFLHLIRADYVFWLTVDNFVCDVMLPIATQHLNIKQPKHIVCPSWNNTPRELLFAINYAHKVLFFTEDNKHWFESYKLLKEIKSKVVVLPLVSAYQLQSIKQKKIEDKIKLLVILGKHMSKDNPDIFLRLNNLAKSTDCNIGLLQLNSLDRELRKDFKQLCQLSNVVHVTYNYLSDLAYIARDYDIVFNTETRYKHGAHVSLLYASNTPVVAYRVPPVTSYISNYSTGYLLPCGVDTVNSPIGKVHGDAQFNSLSLLLVGKDFTRMQRNIAENYKSSQLNFQDKLNELLS